ncbi:hypothetical protein Q8F55_004826 [Vanrija albida]|uniref:Uncharacterized protein n=1 Tax=Vanrija albida TaxID=181172 RepID=A0ABR3Q008_9TREE
MDDLGLPISFGKQKAEQRPTHPLPSRPEAGAAPARGEASARGPRGAVGRGKRSRGGHARRPAREEAGEGEGGSGVKRAHSPSSSPARPPPSFVSGANRSAFGARGGGAGRGRGGHAHSDGGPSRGGGGGGTGGLWKESYVEDPWRGLTPRLAGTAGV